MAELIKVVKPKKYESSFISVNKSAFLDFCKKTQKKNAVVLYSLLAGNKDGFGILLTADNVMKLWGIADYNMANSITRSEIVNELKRLNYINNKGEFNEFGWDKEEENKEDTQEKIVDFPNTSTVVLNSKEIEKHPTAKEILDQWGL